MAFILDTIIGTVGTIIDRVIPDKNAAAKAKAEFELFSATKEFELMINQIEVNKEQAKHPSIFVAGGRPFFFWLFGIIVAYHLLIYPIVITIAAFTGFDTSVLPQFDIAVVWGAISGLLGLGTMRTSEKLKGVARENMKSTPDLPKPF